MDRLTNTIRPYAWGSTTAIPRLLGVEPTGEPQAEMWMGAHPGAPSRLDRGGGETTLSDVIAADPERELGAAAVAKFGPRLPFLLKLLAAGAPLSLQVHPDLAQAKEGYEDEERRGVPMDAYHRNYKDPNHKPEMICAITPFDGLCGFRPPLEAADLLEGLGVNSLKPYVDLLRAHPEEAALREVLTAVLTADRTEMARTVTEAAAAAARLGGPYEPYASLVHDYPGDPGVIAAMLLNHVRLQPGEAMFLGAGCPARLHRRPRRRTARQLRQRAARRAHPQARGRPGAAEGGRLRTQRPRSDAPRGQRRRGLRDPHRRIPPLPLRPGPRRRPRVLPDTAPQILLCTAGSPKATSPVSGELALAPGESVFVPAGEKVELSQTGTVFRATVVV